MKRASLLSPSQHKSVVFETCAWKFLCCMNEVGCPFSDRCCCWCPLVTKIYRREIWTYISWCWTWCGLRSVNSRRKNKSRQIHFARSTFCFPFDWTLCSEREHNREWIISKQQRLIRTRIFKASARFINALESTGTGAEGQRYANLHSFGSSLNHQVTSSRIVSWFWVPTMLNRIIGPSIKLHQVQCKRLLNSFDFDRLSSICRSKVRLVLRRRFLLKSQSKTFF